MFDRFTDRARKVMGLAKAEAQRLNHEYIGTEHVLLGFVAEGSGVGANALRQMGVELPKIRAAVERIARPSEWAPTSGNLPFTPRAKKSLECAVESASELGHNYVGTEHLLLGLIKENEGIAARVLLNFGVKVESARDEILDLLASDGARSLSYPTSPRRFDPAAPPIDCAPLSIAVAALETLGRLGVPAAVAPPASPAGDAVELLRRRLAHAEQHTALLRAQLAAHAHAPTRSAERSASERDDDGPPPTRRLLAVLQLAAAAARQYGHAAVGSEHLLLALLEQPVDLFPRGLARVGFDRATLQATISRWSERRRGTLPVAAPIEWTPEAAQLLLDARGPARAQGRRHTAVGHALLALIDRPADPATAALARAGVDLARLRAFVEAELDDGGAADEIEALGDWLDAAATRSGAWRVEFDQHADELRALGGAIQSLQRRIEG